MLTRLPDPPNAEARRVIARQVRACEAWRAFYGTLAAASCAAAILAVCEGNLPALLFLVSGVLALLHSAGRSSRAIGRLRAESAALACQPPSRHRTVTLPARFEDRAILRVDCPEGGTITVRNATGWFVCSVGWPVFCQYEADRDLWHTVTPPPAGKAPYGPWRSVLALSPDGSGERLATSSEAAEARADPECRTWGLFARVR